jgi:beta-glucuronidase
MWSEEYQSELVAMHQRVFDRVEAVVGEHVWAFADFATPQGVMRVGGNRKGVFTRDRQPKAVAQALRLRWRALREKVLINWRKS